MDYVDTYASVAHSDSIRILLALAAQEGLDISSFDVKTAFLHGDIDMELYVEQLKGFEVKGKEDWVWRLNKSLYGTKQAPQCWQKRFQEFFARLRFKATSADDAVY